MIKFIKKLFIKEGKVITKWPAKDLREDILVVDISRLKENIVGVKRRKYCVYKRTEPVPDYSDEIENININEL